MLWIARFLYLAMTISIATDALVYGLEKQNGTQFTLGILAAILTLALGVGVIVLDAITKNKEITTLSAIYFGLLLGFLVGSLFWASAVIFSACSRVSVPTRAGSPCSASAAASASSR